VHALDAADAAYLPISQLAHFNEPWPAANMPAAQPLHTNSAASESSLENCPAPQLKQLYGLAKLCALPATHLVHVADPISEYRPTAHSAQLNAPNPDMYIPLAQLTHTCEPVEP